MTLFKAKPGLSSNSGESEPAQLRHLASVSPTQPNFEQVYDGMNLYGALKDGQATIRIKLSKQTDCSANYVCELRETDASGKEMITSTRLVQLTSDSVPSEFDPSISTSILMRLSSFMERFDVKMEIMDDRYKELKKDFIEHKKEIMDKIDSLEDKSLARFRDIEDKICHIESKLFAIDSDAIQDKVLRTITSQIDTYFKKVLTSFELTDGTLNRTADIFSSLSYNNTVFQSTIMKNYQNFLNNVTRGMDVLFTNNRNITDTMETNFITFKEDINFSWQQLELNTNASVSKTLNSLQYITSELNSTLAGNVDSAVTKFFMPERCRKNTLVTLHPASTPYPVIYRSEFPGVLTPLLCDTVTDGGGWIVIQRRSTGDVDFYRNWESYKNGFGALNSDFWLGNEKIYSITSTGQYELRVELKIQDQLKFAHYRSFSLAGEDKNYAISVASYSGTAGNALDYHNGHSFSTFDKDNDVHGSNCAANSNGAWWYRGCYHSELNIRWSKLAWSGLSGNPSFSEMKIRRIEA
ncbi:hypothetical protein EGW08_000048 [Elysia chlorotica]|uniref:Fibrinogen C-terminal domain-containing protein n=1 Tax=Elysia chlorotica TaxID=188477 RepID=A0A3S1AHA6_ELYCH|nr:hypothetical protein EGW08_000048 [Elysia chlorotica]